MNNNDYYYTTSEEITAEKKSSGKVEKGLKKLLVLAAVIFAAQLIWLFGLSPFIPFSTIEVNGFDGLNRDEILYLAGINDNSSYISANIKDIKERITAHVLVESAVVIKRFPDRLTMFLNPREAAAVAIMNTNSAQIPLLIDRHGVIFKIGDIDSIDSNLPVISGIENPQLNTRLPSSLLSLLKNLHAMSSASPELLSAISEIRVERKAWDGYDFVIFPVHSSIKVRVDDNLTEDTLRYMLLVLNVFENSDQKTQEIDFRSGIGSYRLKVN
ncbi:MAG: FtsQ-type POTRA domain-containing protein [Treponema sp.]|nr:FtsQ-type POTRA domain-containing protein [Treponema sp.]